MSRKNRGRGRRSPQAIERLEPRRLLAVIINEFLAQNSNGITDEDGDHSDFIELRNTDAATVDLAGWYLTDDPANLTKWQFPSTNLAANGYLTVFASNKNRAVAGQELHTNFALDNDGEDLLLVMPDGTTVADSYLAFPDQRADVSYGIGASTSSTTNVTLVGASSTVKAFVPSAANAAVDDHFREIGFDDSGWPSGTRSVGFDRDGTPNFNTFIGRTFSTLEWPNTNPARSGYVRYAFNLANKEQLSALTLTIRFDDGFIAYLNDQEVQRVNFLESFQNPQPAWNSAAGTMVPPGATNRAISRGAEATTTVTFDLTPYLPELVNGANVLAFQLVNSSVSDTDLLLEPVLTATRATAPASNNYMVSPTPAAANGLGTLGFVDDTHFSVDAGFFDASFLLDITSNTPGAEIRYTLDGSAPTASSGTVYTGPISISPPPTGHAGVVLVRAAAFKAGYVSTNVDTNSYVFLDKVIRQNGTGLPSSATWGHDKEDGDTASGFNLSNEADWTMDGSIVNNPIWASTIVNDLKSIPTISVVMNWNDLFGGTPQPGTPLALGGEVAVNPQGIYIHGRSDERAASLEYFNPNNANDRFQVDGSVEVQGHASPNRWGDDKLSLQVKFKDRYGPDTLTYPLFADTPYGANAAASFDTLILDAGYNYTFGHATEHNRATYINDQVMADLQNAAGGAAAHGKFVHLYLNGLYWGVYDIHERPDESFADQYFGGSKDDYDVIKHNSSVTKRYTWSNGGITAENTFQALLDSTLAVFNNPSGPAGDAAYQNVQSLLEIDGFLDYMILHYYGGSGDWPQNNWYATRNRVEPNSKWRFHEWDQEHAFSSTENNTADTGGPPGMIHIRLMANAEYKLRFNDRVQKLMRNDGLLTPTAATAAYNARKTEIDRAIVGESARWGDNRMVTSGTRYTPTHWLNTMTALMHPTTGFFATRTNAVIGYFNGASWLLPTAAPNFSDYGGSVSPGTILTMTNPGSGTIYYTIDGSDPRASGGAILGTPYSGPITINQSVRIRARVNSGGNWSPEIDAPFVVGGSLPLRISELHYNPDSFPGVADAQDIEFIELLNTGSQTIGLDGVQIAGFANEPYVFSGGLTLDAGERIIVARTPAVFQFVYGNGINLAPTGYADANLSNGGEPVVLKGPLGETLQSFIFDDAAPWPTAPDGTGPSLEIVDPLGDPTDPANWRASSAIGGSPGSEGATPVAPTVVGGSFDRETAHRIVIQFSEDVSASLAASDLQITLLPGGSPFAAGSVTWDAPTKTATFTTASLLSDGDYLATLAAGAVDHAGAPLATPYELPFFVMSADADHDRDVDVTDLGILAGNWQQSPRTFSQGDFDYSGTVDVTDLGILASKWQQVLSLPSAPTAPNPRRTTPRVFDRISPDL